MTTEAEQAYLRREATEAKCQMRECVRSMKSLLDLRLWMHRHPGLTAGAATVAMAGAGWGVGRTVRRRGTKVRRRPRKGALRHSVVLTARAFRKAVVGTLIARVITGLTDGLCQTPTPQESRRTNGRDRQSSDE